MLCKYLNPRVETTPAKRPMHKAAAGLVKIPLGAPMITPPARVALRMSSIENFSLTIEVMMKVPKQLPVNEIIVFVMITLFS